MDSADSIGVYGEAKAEYTRQLCIFLIPALEGYFLDLLAETKEQEKDSRRVLWAFQDKLKQFPDWNVDKVQRETEKVSIAAKCDYLEEILTAVFIAHTKVLSAIRLTSKQKKLQITIPKLDHFLHRTMSECARQLWSNAYLFSEIGSSIERQKNLRQVEQLLHEAVLQSIRGMLPVKSILKEYLNDDGEEETPAAATTTEQESEPIVQEGNLVTEEKSEVKPFEDAETVAPIVLDLSANLAPVAEAVASAVEAVAPVAEAVAPVAEAVASAVEAVAPVAEAVAPVVEAAAAAATPAPIVEALAPRSAPTIPTIVVDTEPVGVVFREMEEIFDSQNPEKTTIRMMTEPSDHDDEEDDRYADGIIIDESAPLEPVDGFEDLNGAAEDSFAVDDFETL